MKNLLKEALKARGISPKQAYRMGLPSYATVYAHYSNQRTLTAEYALLYEKVLGIPRWELRPDLWNPEHCGKCQHLMEKQ